MADQKSIEKLNKAIQEAHSALSKTFGDVGSAKYESMTYFKEDGLAAAYQKEEVFTNMAKQLSSLGREIRSMRSSYLPIELFKKDEVLKSTLSDMLADRESYENAFMRMLGMPESEELGFAARGTEDAEGDVTGSIKYITEEGYLKTGSFRDIEEEILNQRASRKADRKVIVNNYIFDIDKRSVETDEDDGIIEASKVKDATKYPKLSEFEDNPFSFSYLLFPPLQDSRFSKCINEPKKIVAPLFGNPKARQINSEKIKPSLLESIIRIRIDRLSGQDSQAALKVAPNKFVKNSTTGIDISLDSDNEELIEPFGESYGIIEALFIIRLRSAISGLAKKFAKDRDEIDEAMERFVMKVTDVDPEEPEDGTGSTTNEGASKRTEWDEMMPDVADFYELKKLKDQLLIEDSMMALLGNNSEAIDLQKNTQRNSSVYDAHLMSGLIGVIDVPRARIKGRISDIEAKRNANYTSIIEPIRADINAILGTDIGIGNLDMLVFSLALFSIPEKHLINLLSDSAYDRMKATTLGDVLDSIGSRSLDGRIAAVNEVTDFAYAGYQLFVGDIGS